MRKVELLPTRACEAGYGPAGVLTKFGSHRAFLRQIDPWMTFDPRWGCFENMSTNLVGPSPTPIPTFSSIPQSMTKRIAGQTDRLTDSFILVI